MLALLFAACALAQAPHPQPRTDTIGPASYIQPPPPNYPFPDGKTWVYTAEWRVWDAGTMTARLDRSGDLQKVTVTGDSIGFVSLLYHLHDRFEAEFDPRTFCSQRVVKHTEEGFRRRDTNIRFDYARRKAVLDETNLKNNQKKHTEEDIPACVTDVLSVFYYVGSLPLPVGSTHTFPLNDGGKTVDLKVTAEAREQIKTDAGTFSTIRLVPEATSGVLKQRGKVWVWMTDDAQHLPVQMRIRMFWGTLTLKLQRVEK